LGLGFGLGLFTFKGISRKISRGEEGGATEKRPKISKKKYRKIALISLFRGGGGSSTEKKTKK